MMAHSLPEILLWLFVINHGIVFSAGLYEQRIVLPQWSGHRSRAFVCVRISLGGSHGVAVGNAQPYPSGPCSD